LPNSRVVIHGGGRWPTSVASDAIETAKVPVGLLTESGEFDSTAAIDGEQFVAVTTQYRGRPRRGVDILRFSPSAHVTVWDSVVVTAWSARYSIELRNSTGAVLGAIEVDRPRRPVSPRMRLAVTNAEVDQLRAPGREPLVDARETERQIRSARFADSLPAFQALHVSSDGILWVVDALAPGDTSWRATAFKLDGSIAGRLEGPAATPPLAFGAGRVVLSERTAEGSVVLRLHRILAP
jgi:hypothetical protein